MIFDTKLLQFSIFQLLKYNGLEREQLEPTHSCSWVNSRQPARLWKGQTLHQGMLTLWESFVEDQHYLMNPSHLL